jgi:TP901 family phage tail tape measure protein
MPGTYQYDVEIKSNVAKLLSDMKQVQDRLDTVEGKEYKIKLNVDEKKLSSVISNLEKMLDSLGKGTGDFKQFENLSKELSSIVSEVQSLSKAFGKVDDSGAKTLLSSIQNIDKSLSELSQNILNVNKNMSNMGGNTSGAVKQVENITNESKKAASALEDVAKAQEKVNGQKTNISSGRKDAFPDKDVSASVESATNSIKEENNVLEQNTQKVKENTQAKEQNANANLNKYDKRLDSYNGKVDKYQATIDRFNDGGWTSDAYLKNVQAVRDAVKQYATLLDNIKTNQNGIATDEDIQNLDKYEKKIKDTIATVTNMSASEKGYNFVSGQKELDKIHKLLNENSKMSSEAKAKIKAYYREIESGNPTMSLDKIHAEIMKIYNAEIEAGRAGRSLKDIFQTSRLHQMVAQVAGMFSFYDLINLGRQFASTVTDINTQITGLAKVSEQSSKQIYADFDSYADIAKEVRGTISDTIAATADWSKNGYSIPDAKQLAEVSQLYKNVGDGIDIDAANESLISTLKGFQLEADQAEHIVDVFNEVSNNEAISSGGIGEALQRSAASFNAASTSLEKSVSLVTATNSVLQDPEKVGNMWRTVSARLRGSETELKEMGEDTDGLVTSTSKLQALVKGITGFDIMKDKDTYKDIYDIVLGIGEKWQDLSDIDRASLLEALAGKQQSNALAAALSNIDILKKSYEEATNAEGSARKENEEYSKSIQASIDLTKAKLEELSNDLLSSNFLKGAIDAGGKLLELLDFIISDGREIPAIFTTIGAVIGAKKLSYASI